MKIIKGFSIFAGLILVYLIVIIFFPVLNVEKQPMKLEKISSRASAPDCRKNVTFKANGLTISGWLYLPKKNTRPVPCIILSQGFCGTKDILLEKYALRFIKAGFAVISFDYRHFGESQGEPRQLYSVLKQLEDIKAAIKFARSLNKVDPEKIFLWGTSSSGNYGIIIAAEDKRIAGVIGQSPSLDPEKDGKIIFNRDGIGWMLSLIVHAQRDKGRSRLGLSSHTFPAVGRPGTTAMHIAPGFFEGYKKFVGNSKTFKNEVCARIMFGSHGPDLLKAAEKVQCPVLFHICGKDVNVAPGSHKRIEKILGKKVNIIVYPIGHFDIYDGNHFEKSITHQIKFLKKHY